MSASRKSAPYHRDLIEQTHAWAVRQGYRITLVRFRSKKVVGSDDEKDEKSYTGDEYQQPGLSAWDEPHNLGVVTGPRRKGPIDIDIDCPEAAFFAEKFLPPTPCIFGRKSKPRSHRLYEVDDVEELAKEALADPLMQGKGANIVELRADDHQTVMPGSTHESGELIWWDEQAKLFGSPAKVPAEMLVRAVRMIAAAVLVARHMWHETLRNDVNLCLCGMFHRNKWPQADAERFIQAIIEFTEDKEGPNRLDNLRKTWTKGDKDKPIKGAKALKELLGEDRHVNKLLQWLGADRNAEVLERFNAQYAVVKVGNTSRIHEFTSEGKSEFWKFQELWNHHSNEWVRLPQPPGAKGPPKAKPAGKWWTEHPERNTYDGVCFEPHGGAVVGNRINLWRGFGVVPKEGDWSLMRDHLLRIISAGDQAVYDYIYWWLAWAVQNPTEVPEVALVFRGNEGTGRGILGRAMCRIFGAHAVHLTSSSQLTGRFNKHLVGACFVFADEAHWAGDKKAEKRLYTMITEPTLSVEPKGVDLFFVPNMAHIMMATNEDWSVPAGQVARRYLAQEVSDEHMQDHAYFKALNAQLDGGGLEAMLWDLLRLDLGDWHPREAVPQTAELEFQKEQSDEVLGIKEKLEHYLDGACARVGYEGGVKVLCHMVRELVGVRDDNDRGVKAVSKAMRELGFKRKKVTQGWHYVRGEPKWVDPMESHIGGGPGYRSVIIERDEDDRHKWNVQLAGSGLENEERGRAPEGAPDY